MLKLENFGTPRERGWQHGETFRDRIRELIAIRRHLIRQYLKSLHILALEHLALSQVEKLQDTRDLFDEFCAIADSANVSLGDLMILNNYTDMRDFQFDPDELTPDAGGCSVFSLRNQDHPICGQTWDMHASATEYLLHLEIKNRADQPVEAHVLTVVGCLGLAGVNQHSVSVLINNLHCTETQIGLMWPALVRHMLKARSATQALENLKKNMPCSGHNYLICDPSESFNVETTGKRFDVTQEVRGALGTAIHTNHYLGNLRSAEIRKRVSSSSRARYQALEEVLKGPTSPPSDTKGLAKSIFLNQTLAMCAPKSAHDSATCGGLIVDLKERKGEFFKGCHYGEDVASIQW